MKRTSRPIEGIPVFKGKAADWLIDYLKTHTKPTKRSLAQAQKDKEIVKQIKPLPQRKRKGNKKMSKETITTEDLVYIEAELRTQAFYFACRDCQHRIKLADKIERVRDGMSISEEMIRHRHCTVSAHCGCYKI